MNEKDIEEKKVHVEPCEETVEIVQLLKNLEKYHNQRITVRGYVRIEFEGTAVFSNARSAKKNMFANALWLDFDPSKWGEEWIHRDGLKYNRRICFVEGVVNTNFLGHFGMYPATLDNIERIGLVGGGAESRSSPKEDGNE